MTDDEIREMAAGISRRDYFDLMNHLHDARTALTRAEQALNLIGPGKLPRHVALDDLVVDIQESAELIGRHAGTNKRTRLAPDLLEDILEAKAEATEVDPATGLLRRLPPVAEATGTDPATGLPLPLSPRERVRRLRWAEAALACVCSPTNCTRADSPGCRVCADLDPEQLCYAPFVAKWNTGNEAVASAARVLLEYETRRLDEAYLHRAGDPEPEDGQ